MINFISNNLSVQQNKLNHGKITNKVSFMARKEEDLFIKSSSNSKKSVIDRFIENKTVTSQDISDLNDLLEDDNKIKKLKLGTHQQEKLLDKLAEYCYAQGTYVPFASIIMYKRLLKFYLTQQDDISINKKLSKISKYFNKPVKINPTDQLTSELFSADSFSTKKVSDDNHILFIDTHIYVPIETLKVLDNIRNDDNAGPYIKALDNTIKASLPDLTDKLLDKVPKKDYKESSITRLIITSKLVSLLSFTDSRHDSQLQNKLLSGMMDIFRLEQSKRNKEKVVKVLRDSSDKMARAAFSTHQKLNMLIEKMETEIKKQNPESRKQILQEEIKKKGFTVIKPGNE